MNKWERIKSLKDLGLNVADGLLVKKGNLNRKEVFGFIDDHGGASIRSFLDDESMVCPFHPGQNVDNAHRLVEELSPNYNIIVSEPIKPEDAKYAGCCMVTEPVPRIVSYLFELKVGPGSTVRMVTEKGLVDKRFTYSSHPEERWEFEKGFEELVTVLQKIHDTGLTNNYIFEFSVYNKPIGHKKSPIIFWEITKTDRLSVGKK